MSWVTIIWAMTASACLTLAVVHVLVWWRRREVPANLLFALTAVAAAVFAGCELWIMRAETPGAFGMAVRWAHVPASVLFCHRGRIDPVSTNADPDGFLAPNEPSGVRPSHPGRLRLQPG